MSRPALLPPPPALPLPALHEGGEIDMLLVSDGDGASDDSTEPSPQYAPEHVGAELPWLLLPPPPLLTRETSSAQ